jgi:hypothetical protein
LFSASKVLALIAGVNGDSRNTYFKGGYDAATNTPDLDVAPAGAIQQGWTYVVTVAGTFYRRCRSRRFNYLETKCAYYFSTLHCS